METLFVTHKNDGRGQTALGILRSLGYQTSLVKGDDVAPESAIALFASEGRYRHSALRVASHRLDGVENHHDVPLWARSTPFQVAMALSVYKNREERFRHALKNLAEEYARWNPWQKEDAPWHPSWPAPWHPS